MRFTDGPEFLKGHGTENDFVLLPDPQGELKLTDARVRALCDRQRGLGADGVLRVIRTGGLDFSPPGISPETWFMDYRNADGSLAEMCGNGIRVFAKYLVAAGWVEHGEQLVGTRSGVRSVNNHPDGRVTVDMGPASVLGKSGTSVGGRRFDGYAIDLGNPHLVCVTEIDPADLDLTDPPPHDPSTFPHGVNVEFVHPIGPERVKMRVHERGVGETRSCGTGTVAATVAALFAQGEHFGRRTVQIPGGMVEVTVTPSTTTLTGSAVLVAAGRLDSDWWEQVEQDEAGPGSLG